MEKDGLAQEEIMDALLDRQGRLWVATESAGITRMDGEVPVQFNERNGLPSDVVYGLLLDRDGSVWAATANGVAHFAKGRIRNYTQQAGLPAAPIFRVMQDASGTLFVGTERGVYRMQGERFVLQSPLLPEDGVPSLARDTAGNLWVGTVNNGLVRLGESGAERFTSVRGLPNNRVAALLVDREGSIWAGTNAGLLRLSDASFSTWNGDQGLSDDYVRALYEAPRGGMWIGTSRGLNLWRDGRIEATYSAADGLPSDSVLSLLESRDGSLLVGSYTDGVLRMRDGKVVGHYDNARGMPGSNQVRAWPRKPTAPCGSAPRVAWRVIAMARSRPTAWPRDSPANSSSRCTSPATAACGSGTANGAANIVAGKVRSLDMRPVNGAQDVFAFHEDADGTLWLATDRGLLRYRNGVLRGLGLKEGLPVDTMFSVVDDERGHLWMTSNRGVLRIKRSDAEAVLEGRLAQLPYDHFGEADGLVSAQCNGGSGPAALRDSRGNIWVATSRGAAVTNPARLQAYRHQLPQVVIEQAYADDKPVSAEDGLLRLPPGTRKLEFRYAALSFLMPRFLRYRYRLEGEDAAWIERGNLRVAQYTNLRPGRYRFLVDVSAPTVGRDWSGEPTVIDIEIKPQPWQQAWFLAVATLLLGLLLFAIYRWRLGNLRKRATELEDVIDQRTSALREQTDRLMESDREKSILLARLKEQSEAFERMALEDALTGIGNRRAGVPGIDHGIRIQRDADSMPSPSLREREVNPSAIRPGPDDRTGPGRRCRCTCPWRFAALIAIDSIFLTAGSRSSNRPATMAESRSRPRVSWVSRWSRSRSRRRSRGIRRPAARWTAPRTS
jgi:ligand-binding sensor domain-containing protein